MYFTLQMNWKSSGGVGIPQRDDPAQTSRLPGEVGLLLIYYLCSLEQDEHEHEWQAHELQLRVSHF